jgi:hypothetical protein
VRVGIIDNWQARNGLVSNLIVIRFLQKFLLVALISVCAVLFLILVAIQVEQRIFRSRGELLLSQVQSLELRKTPWPEAQRQVKRWAGGSKFDDQCNGSECSEEIMLIEPVYGFVSRSLIFVHLDDYLRWRLKLSYDEGPFVRMASGLLRGYMVIGGRPAKVTATLGMWDGVLWSKGFTVNIETYWHNIPGLFGGSWGEFTLISHVGSVPQFDSSGPDHGDPQLRLHPSYIIRRQAGCCSFNAGYVHFTPYADPGDVQRLMQLDLSCLTRIRPCLDQIDIMPAAWKQYFAENPGN